MSGTVVTDDLLPRMARTLGEATGAHRADVWLETDDGLRRESSWPVAESDEPRVLSPGSIPPCGEPGQAAPVRHQGDLLGWLVVNKRPGDPLRPEESRLLDDLASQAGLVLRNIRLIEDLRASRHRLVAAQDQERRRLERNIHDGCQQRLVALSVRLRLAQRFVDPGSNGDRQLLEQLVTQTVDTLDNLRDLARGIYPPLLADQGLAAALEAQARKAPIPVQVLATGVDRYGQDIESAVYFSCLEALQNVAKYAGAAKALIRLDATKKVLRFEVHDDGTGFDVASTPRGSGLTNMEDRLAVVGAALQISSRPGAGTSISAVVPVGRDARAALLQETA
jgi:signal transduction histidine kinase